MKKPKSTDENKMVLRAQLTLTYGFLQNKVVDMKKLNYTELNHLLTGVIGDKL
ncbi:hypothetical protein [Winogradskyella ursingii]|uniref:hypothetical protein n=1 Tax=Winogradskyella ursingii TaxID=2686079 RepID=UPI0015C8426D|nr:hypothetical protein [Winogradskyella ursingii]